MIVEMDKKGRVLIPKKIRDKLNLREGTKFRLRIEDEKIILVKEESTAERYAGKYKAKIPIPKDLDDFLNMVIQNWWKENM